MVVGWDHFLSSENYATVLNFIFRLFQKRLLRRSEDLCVGACTVFVQVKVSP